MGNGLTLPLAQRILEKVKKAGIVGLRRGERLIVVVQERGCIEEACCLKELARRSQQEGVREIWIDLENCSYVDSTFLGIMVGLAMFMGKQNGTVRVVKASVRSREAMAVLGVDRLLGLCSEASGIEGEKVEIPESGPTNRQLAKALVAEAHRNLIEWDPGNAARFQPVLELLGTPGTNMGQSS